MSRFGNFAWGNNDDESSSEEQDSSEQEEVKGVADAGPAGKVKGYGQSSSDDESDEERVIKSGAEKKSEALHKALDDVRKSANNGDFNMMDSNFEKLEKEIAKTRDTLFKENGDKIPSYVLKVFE